MQFIEYCSRPRDSDPHRLSTNADLHTKGGFVALIHDQYEVQLSAVRGMLALKGSRTEILSCKEKW